MADAVVRLDVGADAEGGTGVERGFEVEGGDTIEERGEAELMLDLIGRQG
jgi:hypothetical protein